MIWFGETLKGPVCHKGRSRFVGTTTHESANKLSLGYVYQNQFSAASFNGNTYPAKVNISPFVTAFQIHK